MDRSFVPDLNEGPWDDFGGLQQVVSPKAEFELKPEGSPRFVYMRYHTGISEDQPVECDSEDIDGEDEDGFDWDFNDCDPEDDQVCTSKENQLKQLHSCMRDELRS